MIGDRLAWFLLFCALVWLSYEVTYPFFSELWRKKQRLIDRTVLWPEIRKQAPSREMAEHAFIQHMLFDPAYKDWLIEDMREYASELP